MKNYYFQILRNHSQQSNHFTDRKKLDNMIEHKNKLDILNYSSVLHKITSSELEPTSTRKSSLRMMNTVRNLAPLAGVFALSFVFPPLFYLSFFTLGHMLGKTLEEGGASYYASKENYQLWRHIKKNGRFLFKRKTRYGRVRNFYYVENDGESWIAVIYSEKFDKTIEMYALEKSYDFEAEDKILRDFQNALTSLNDIKN